MRLWLIRHGEVDGDPFIRPQPPVTGCLSRRGVLQARATAQALAGERIDLALTSPYARAVQTAETIMAGRPGAVRIVEAFHEWLPAAAVRDPSAAEAEAMQQRDTKRFAEETWKTEQGEGAFDIYARVVPALLSELATVGLHHRLGGWEANAGAKDLGVAVVAHGGSLNVMLAFILGVAPFPVGRFDFDLAGVAEVRFSERRGIHYPALRLPARAVATEVVPR
jgi:broad specificity phosphatase PhoE